MHRARARVHAGPTQGGKSVSNMRCIAASAAHPWLTPEPEPPAPAPARSRLRKPGYADPGQPLQAAQTRLRRPGCADPGHAPVAPDRAGKAAPCAKPQDATCPRACSCHPYSRRPPYEQDALRNCERPTPSGATPLPLTSSLRRHGMRSARGRVLATPTQGDRPMSKMRCAAASARPPLAPPPSP
jgi:hypothetical protein